MISTLSKGLNHTAPFLFSAFSTDAWMAVIIGAIGVALLALIVCGFIFHVASNFASTLIAAGVLSLFAVPLGLGIYFLNKDQFKTKTSNEYSSPLA